MMYMCMMYMWDDMLLSSVGVGGNLLLRGDEAGMRTCDAFRHTAAKSRELLLKITGG